MNSRYNMQENMKQHLIVVIMSFCAVFPVCAQSSYWIEGSTYQGAVFDATETFEYPAPLSDIQERYAPKEIDIARAEHILSDNIDFHTFFVERMCTEIICRENLHLYNRQYWGFITKMRGDTVIWMQLISKNYSTKERLMDSWQSIIDGGEHDWSVAVNITRGFLYDMNISPTENGIIYLDCWGSARKTYFPLLPSDYRNFISVRKKDVCLGESTKDIIRLYIKDYKDGKGIDLIKGFVINTWSDSLYYYLSLYTNYSNSPMCRENYWGMATIGGYNIYVFGEQTDIFFHSSSNGYSRTCENSIERYYYPKWTIVVNKQDTSLCSIQTKIESSHFSILDIEKIWNKNNQQQ